MKQPKKLTRAQKIKFTKSLIEKYGNMTQDEVEAKLKEWHKSQSSKVMMR